MPLARSHRKTLVASSSAKTSALGCPRRRGACVRQGQPSPATGMPPQRKRGERPCPCLFHSPRGCLSADSIDINVWLCFSCAWMPRGVGPTKVQGLDFPPRTHGCPWRMLPRRIWFALLSPRARGCSSEVALESQHSSPRAWMFPRPSGAVQARLTLLPARGDVPSRSMSPRSTSSTSPRARGCSVAIEVGRMRWRSPCSRGCTFRPRVREGQEGAFSMLAWMHRSAVRPDSFPALPLSSLRTRMPRFPRPA